MLSGLNFNGLHWKYLAVVWILIISFPGYYQATTRPGLDASWIYAVNYLTQTHFVPGRDFAHNYGPLGYLLHPLNVGSNLIYGTAFRLAIHCVFAACLFFYAHKAKSVLPILAFAIGYAISMVDLITLEYTYHLLIVESLLFCVSLTDKRLWWIAAPACAALAASILFMKFGIGIAAAAILATATIIWLFTRQRPAWEIVLGTGGPYLVTILFLSAVYLGSTQTFVAWIEHSVSLGDGFVVAQSMVGPRRFLFVALLALAVYVGMVYWLYKEKSALRYVAPVFALAMFLAFKHGFVRLYGHERNFFPFLLASISVVALNMTTRSEFKTVAISYCLVFAASVPVGAYYFADPNWPPAHQTLLGQTGISNIISTIRLTDTRDKLDLESVRNLESRPLPKGWVAEINQENGAVDAIPWELSYVLGNNLA